MSSSKAKRIPCILALVLCLFFCSAFKTHAATLNVPQDYSTIQAAIVAAQDGDTVLVGPGTYVEHINFLAKGITVASSAGPEVTIIDGSSKGTIVTIKYTEQKQCGLQGFTLRNGSGYFATAIDIGNSSPTITGNIIDGNTGWTYGAIFANVSSPVIEKNIFRNFFCADSTISGVVSFESQSSPKVMDNLFLNNPCTAINFVSPSGTSPQVANNTIVGNRVGIGHNYPSSFSALHLYRNNIIVGNNVGFRIFSGTLPSDSVWQNNLVYGNATNYSGISDLTGIGGNISTDPLFLNAANNDYHLCLGSPAIGAGDITGLNLPATDFDGNPRVVDGNIDMGAYQSDPDAPPRVSFTADKVSGASPLQVQFTSFTDKYVTYQWDFGDGTPGSSEANPLHSFGPGVYTIGLTVFGPTGTGAVTKKDLIQSLMAHTITASAGVGGKITPPGATTVGEGSSLTYTVTPNPSYQLAGLFVDGVNVAGPSLIPLNYTFNDIIADHTITAVFAHYFDYFGMQDGHHEESLVIYANGRKRTLTDDISLDTTTFPQPSYIDSENAGGAATQGWYQVLPNGLFQKQIQGSGYTFTLSPALPMIETPVRPGSSWTASSTASVNGTSETGTITGKVSPQVLVSVPAGRFLAWPIAYTFTVSGPYRTSTSSWTYWFAPYFGNVKGRDSKSITRLTKSAVGGGTVTSIPPVVTGVTPKSAPHGSTITVNGYQFGATQDMSQVRIGNAECDQILTWSDTQIQCIVPDTASSGAVSVITDIWTSNDTVKLVVPPQITGIAPSWGKHGSTVVLAGTNFGSAPGKVKLGTVFAIATQWSDTSITFTVPATMPYGAYPVKVINSQGQGVLPKAFTVVK